MDKFVAQLAEAEDKLETFSIEIHDPSNHFNMSPLEQKQEELMNLLTFTNIDLINDV
jgi:hypothetical protein